MPKFFRRQHVAIASALREANPALYDRSTNDPIRRDVWLDTVNAFARILAADNPNFSLSKFLSACGVEDAASEGIAE